MKRFALCALLALAGCGERPKSTMPPLADVQAVVEPKPRPTAAILTDPAASDKYNSSLEAWGDRLSAAGRRLCTFFVAQGLKATCQKN